MRAGLKLLTASLLALVMCAPGAAVFGQGRSSDAARGDKRRSVRSMTIPVTVRLPEGREQQQEMSSIDVLTVFEDSEPQETLAIRGATQSPLTMAILIQDDLASPAGGEIKGVADFIRDLPPGSRVMIGYLRAGSLQVRQKFTVDLETAAKKLRIPIGSASASPFNPFTQLRDAVKRFEGQPVGRRAILMVSDGLDLSRGVGSSTPTQSLDLQRAIDEAQRRGIAVYSIYAPTAGGTAGGNQGFVGNGQGSLNRLADETGGQAFFQGTGAPVSFNPFLRQLGVLLSRQFALTYLSTHASKGFHRIRIESNLTEGSIRHPSGYTR